jgi:inositol monophosphatase 3
MANTTAVKARPVILVTAIGVGVLFCMYYFSSGKRATGPDGVRVSEVIAASIDLVQRGGEVVRTVRKDESIGTKVKGKTSVNSNDYVTEGDKRSHQTIVTGLKSLWPSLNYVSEEHVAVESDGKNPVPPTSNPEVDKVADHDPMVPMEDILVWIDPLDATQEYTEGGERPDLLKYVTVMMCVAVKGEPVAGVIHQAFNGDEGKTYWGWQGHGFSDSITTDVKRAAIKASNTPVETMPVKAIVSRSHAGTAQQELEKLFGKVEVAQAAGAGYKVLQVLTGQTDLYFHSTLIKKWDLCAGDAMLRAAGGTMTTRKGQEPVYLTGDPKNPDGVVASLAHHEFYLSKAQL